MSTNRFFIIALICLGFAAGEPVSASTFGPAVDYNLFTIGDAFLISSDAKGSVAIGGNATLSSYNVASNRSGDAARLVVDKNLIFTNGEVGTGGSGTIFAQSATLTRTTPSAYQTTDSGLDFGAAAEYLKNASAAWGRLADSATTVSQTGTVELTGTDPALNVFSLDGETLLAANTLNINAPTGSTVLVNISGSASGITNMGYSLTGIENTNILYNFYEATSLALTGVGIQGSVLAPLAAVDFTNGNIDGQMFAGSLGSNDAPSTGQFHDVCFQGELPSVPLPGAVWLLGTGIIGLVGLRRKHHFPAN